MLNNQMPGLGTTEFKEERRLRILLIAACAYIALTLFANLGSLRVIFLAGLSIDGGTLLYPLTFTARDLLHKKAGAALTRFIIILAAVLNILMFLFIYLIAILPADMAVGPQMEYGQVLLPGIRLVAASIVAMTAAELLDTHIYSLVKAKYGSKKQWLRVLLSNAVSIPIDTLIFLAIAFAGVLPLSVLGSLFIANLLIKYIVNIFSLGGIYFVKEDRS